MADISDASMVTRTDGATHLLSESARAVISREEFLNIFLSELSHQDPFEPMSNAQFAQQIAQIESMRASEELTEGIGALLKQQQISSAGALIGKVVRGGTVQGGLVEGVVQRVAVDRNGVHLIIAGFDVPLDNVLEIRPEQPSDEET